MKKLDPARTITIYERDGPHDTFGWGIVFSDQTFSYLEENDRPSYEAITRRCETWDNVVIVHKDEKVTVRGNRFSGIGRLAFLDILHERCRDLGIDIRFHTNITDVNALEGYDLLVGADGANSLVRRAFEEYFQPALEEARDNSFTG
jgi:anthraniloyl-CoA monooxygenase